MADGDASARAERLKAALRDNLRRRKAQARGRTRPPAEEEAGEPEPEPKPKRPDETA